MAATKTKKPAVKRPAKSQPDLEAIFALQVRATKLPVPKREYRFHPVRKWQFDFAWPLHMVAVEIEGGIAIGGRHVRPVGFRNDCCKYAEAAIHGWRVIRGDSQMVKTGVLLGYLERILASSI